VAEQNTQLQDPKMTQVLSEVSDVLQLQQENEKLKLEIAQYKTQNIAVLGDGQVFIKRAQNGILKAVRGAITLRESNGEIAEIEGKFMTTSKGFLLANQVAGLTIVTPDRFQDTEGRMVSNPHPIMDEKSGTISKVMVKKLAIGYSPIGNLVITSATLLYDTKIYFIQDLVKKVRNCKDAGRICMAQSITEEERKTGEFYRIDGELGVWVKFSHAEILKALSTFMQKKTFAERNAQSICERLVFSKHPALAHIAYVQGVGVEKNSTARVPIVGFIFDVTRQELQNLAEAAEKGEEIRIQGQQVEVQNVGTVSATEAEMSIEKDPEEKTEEHPPTGEVVTPPPLVQDLKSAIANDGAEDLFGGSESY
jgi:hypothetical protein